MKLRIFVLAGLLVLGSIPVGACEKCISWYDMETLNETKQCTNDYDIWAPEYAGCTVVTFCGRKSPGGNSCPEQCDGELCVVA